MIIESHLHQEKIRGKRWWIKIKSAEALENLIKARRRGRQRREKGP